MGMLTVVQKSRGLDAPDPAADFSPAEVCASQDSTDASQHGLNAQVGGGQASAYRTAKRDCSQRAGVR